MPSLRRSVRASRAKRRKRAELVMLNNGAITLPHDDAPVGLFDHAALAAGLDALAAPLLHVLEAIATRSPGPRRSGRRRGGGRVRRRCLAAARLRSLILALEAAGIIRPLRFGTSARIAFPLRIAARLSFAQQTGIVCRRPSRPAWVQASGIAAAGRLAPSRALERCRRIFAALNGTSGLPSASFAAGRPSPRLLALGVWTWRGGWVSPPGWSRRSDFAASRRLTSGGAVCNGRRTGGVPVRVDGAPGRPGGWHLWLSGRLAAPFALRAPAVRPPASFLPPLPCCSLGCNCANFSRTSPCSCLTPKMQRRSERRLRRKWQPRSEESACAWESYPRQSHPGVCCWLNVATL